MKSLIVNADDFGRSPGVNRGVLEAHLNGVVTSATLMANAPATEDAAALAKRLVHLDVGVHLVLTFGRPLCDPAEVPSLVQTGGVFPRTAGEVLGAGRVVPEEALREFRAQYARARSLLGREPTHLDSHHFTQDEPAVSWALRELACETGAAARQQSETQRDDYRSHGIRTPDRFVREFQFSGRIGFADLERLLQRIAAEGDGVTELMCHPARPDPELLDGSAYAHEREEELTTLCDPKLPDVLARCGLALATFSACA